jgi:hypothetical protein
MTGSLSDIAVRDEARRCGQMRGRRLTLVSRFTPHVSRFLGAGRARRRWSQIVRRSRKVNIGQAPSNKPPANRLRCGDIKATIWQNVSEKGPFFSTTFSRPFMDQSGAWRIGTSFGLNDLEALVNIAREAKSGLPLMP